MKIIVEFEPDETPARASPLLRHWVTAAGETSFVCGSRLIAEIEGECPVRKQEEK